MTCPRCGDTGEGSGHFGILDCQEPGCNAATERAALNTWFESHRQDNPYDQRWAVYQYAMRLCEEKIAAQSLVVGVQKRRKGDK